MRVHLDLELASPLRLDEVGVDVWSRHKDTVPIVCSYAIDDGPVHSFTFTGTSLFFVLPLPSSPFPL